MERCSLGCGFELWLLGKYLRVLVGFIKLLKHINYLEKVYGLEEARILDIVILRGKKR